MSKDTKKGRQAEATASVLVALTGSAAKAGSLEALLGRLRPREDAALVVVLQQRETLDEERLREAAAQGEHDLVEIADEAPIEAGRLYLMPPA